jgi:hypothetical protein
VQRKHSFVFFLVALVDNEPVLCHQISSSMAPKPTPSWLALTWNHVPFAGSEENVSSWLVQFGEEPQYEEFMREFQKAMWQSLHQVPWSKAKVSSFNSRKDISNLGDIVDG